MVTAQWSATGRAPTRSICQLDPHSPVRKQRAAYFCSFSDGDGPGGRGGTLGAPPLPTPLALPTPLLEALPQVAPGECDDDDDGGGAAAGAAAGSDDRRSGGLGNKSEEGRLPRLERRSSPLPFSLSLKDTDARSSLPRV